MIQAGRTIGSYRIVSKIATGGMGSVYLAEHPVLTGKRVALKVIHHELVNNEDIAKRFVQEAQSVSRIGHEHIIEIHDFGVTEEGDQFYIMEYLEGRTLAELLGQETILEVPRAKKIGAEIAEALASAHAAGVIHRDLKPDNVMLISRHGDDDFVKVLDFGLAKLFAIDSLVETQNGVLLGTPQYMSPEACEGKRKVDHRTDIYALGVLLYQMVTGQLPFDGLSMASILIKQVKQPPTPPRELNPNLRASLEQLILRCLAKQPELRYQSMNELRDALLEPDEEKTALTALQSASSALVHAAIGVGEPDTAQQPVAGEIGAVTEITRLPAVAAVDEQTTNIRVGTPPDDEDDEDFRDDEPETATAEAETAEADPELETAQNFRLRRSAESPTITAVDVMSETPETPETEPSLNTTIRGPRRTPLFGANKVSMVPDPPRITPKMSKTVAALQPDEPMHAVERKSMIATVAAVMSVHSGAGKRPMPGAGSARTAMLPRRERGARWPYVVGAFVLLGIASGVIAIVSLTGGETPAPLAAPVDAAVAALPRVDAAELVASPSGSGSGSGRGSAGSDDGSAAASDAATIGRVELVSEPPGATVFGPDNSNLGTTPIIVPWPITSTPATFRFELFGFQTKQQDVVVTATTSIRVVLDKDRRHHPGSHPRPHKPGSAAAEP